MEYMKNKIIDHGNGLIEHTTYYHNGNIRFHYTTLNSRFHGECIYYYDNGDLCYHDYRKNDQLEGEELAYKKKI